MPVLAVVGFVAASCGGSGDDGDDAEPVDPPDTTAAASNDSDGADAEPADAPDTTAAASNDSDGADEAAAALSCDSPEHSFAMGHITPPTSPFSIVDTWFADEINARTGGCVEYEIGYAGSMGGGFELLQLVQSGALEAGAIVESYFPEELPLLGGITDFWFTFPDQDSASTVGRKLLSEFPEFEEEAAGANIKLMYKHVVSPYMMIGNSNDCTLSGLEGQQVRTWGTRVPEAVGAAGAVGVNLAPAEIYEALQRGTVDMALYDLAGMGPFGFAEVADYMCSANIGAVFAFGHYMNLDTWESLSPEIQAVFEEVMEETYAYSLTTVTEAIDTSRAALEEGGVEFLDFPAADLEEWYSRYNFIDSWLESVPDDVRPTADAIAARVRELS